MQHVNLSGVTTLEEFYTTLRSEQEKNEGEDYCAHHDALVWCMTNGCTSYKELGTHQGATLAAVLRTNPEYVECVDINMDKFREYLRPIANKYCLENNITLKIKECDSTSLASMGQDVDVLLIDSLHYDYHLKKELDLHAPSVLQYIVLHDTVARQQLYDEAVRFCNSNKQWSISKHFDKNVGYTILARN